MSHEALVLDEALPQSIQGHAAQIGIPEAFPDPNTCNAFQSIGGIRKRVPLDHQRTDEGRDPSVHSNDEALTSILPTDRHLGPWVSRFLQLLLGLGLPALNSQIPHLDPLPDPEKEVFPKSSGQSGMNFPLLEPRPRDHAEFGQQAPGRLLQGTLHRLEAIRHPHSLEG